MNKEYLRNSFLHWAEQGRPTIDQTPEHPDPEIVERIVADIAARSHHFQAYGLSWSDVYKHYENTEYKETRMTRIKRILARLWSPIEYFVQPTKTTATSSRRKNLAKKN